MGVVIIMEQVGAPEFLPCEGTSKSERTETLVFVDKFGNREGTYHRMKELYALFTSNPWISICLLIGI